MVTRRNKLYFLNNFDIGFDRISVLYLIHVDLNLLIDYVPTYLLYQLRTRNKMIYLNRYYWHITTKLTFWNYFTQVIEEKPPPCPYEFFSISKRNKICAVHLDKYYDYKKSCSLMLSMSDFTGTCDNPVVTEWRIERKFNSKVSERFPTAICGGRQSCTISTLYKVNNVYFAYFCFHCMHVRFLVFFISGNGMILELEISWNTCLT